MDTSDQALDEAAGFQEGFRTYLPLYNDYTGSSLSLEQDVQRPYDELREIDFARLSDVARRCRRLAGDFEEQLEDVNTHLASVDGWTGDAANAFRGHIQRFQTASQTIDEDLEAIAAATGDAVPAGQRVITEYVAAIGDIEFAGFDSPGDIQFMIDVERMLKSVGDVISAVTGWLGDLIGVALPLPGGGLFGAVTGFVTDRIGDAVDVILDALGMSVDAFLEWIAAKVREYLDASFKTPFESNLRLLNDAVDEATAGIREAFQPIVDAAGAVTENPFAALPIPPEGDPIQPPAGTAVPGGAPPGGVPPAGGVSSVGGAPPAGGAPSVGGVSSVGGVPPGGAGMPGGEPPGGAQPVPGGRPDDLPRGAGWIADPSQLPHGWTVDAATGELLPPGAPGGAGDQEVHSPAGQDVLSGEASILPAGGGTGPPIDGALPGAESGPSQIAIRDGDVTITVSPGGQDSGIEVGLTGGDGDEPAATVATAVGFVAAEPVGAPVSGEVTGGPSYATGYLGGLPDGPVSTGAISGGHGVHHGSGAAQLATAADTGAAGPGAAQLASVGDEPRAGQHGGAGGPMMPITGAIAGGDGERRAGAWRVPGDDVFDTEEPPADIADLPGMLGGNR